MKKYEYRLTKEKLYKIMEDRSINVYGLSCQSILKKYGLKDTSDLVYEVLKLSNFPMAKEMEEVLGEKGIVEESIFKDKQLWDSIVEDLGVTSDNLQFAGWELDRMLCILATAKCVPPTDGESNNLYAGHTYRTDNDDLIISVYTY